MNYSECEPAPSSRPRALVVYQSTFGNTETIARAISDGLGSCMSVDVVEIGIAPTVLQDVDLIVAGGPTLAFGPRRSLDGDGFVSSKSRLHEWLAALRGEPRVAPTATFDTRVRRPRLGGSRPTGRPRRRTAAAPAGEPMSFYVKGMLGPLEEGEPDRAQRWGEELARSLASSAAA